MLLLLRMEVRVLRMAVGMRVLRGLVDVLRRHITCCRSASTSAADVASWNHKRPHRP